MYEFRKIGKVLRVNLLGPDTRLIKKKRIYRASVSQSLRNTVSEHKEQHLTQRVFHSYSELFPTHVFYKHEAKFKIRENAVFIVPMLPADAAMKTQQHSSTNALFCIIKRQ